MTEVKTPSGSVQSDTPFDGIIGNNASTEGSKTTGSFDGLIDDIRLCNKDLPESEVIDLYNLR